MLGAAAPPPASTDGSAPMTATLPGAAPAAAAWPAAAQLPGGGLAVLAAAGAAPLQDGAYPAAAAAGAPPFMPRPGSALSVHSSAAGGEPGPLSVPALKALRHSLSRQASAGLLGGEHPSLSQPGSPSSTVGTPKVALGRSKLGLAGGFGGDGAAEPPLPGVRAGRPGELGWPPGLAARAAMLSAGAEGRQGWARAGRAGPARQPRVVWERGGRALRLLVRGRA